MGKKEDDKKYYEANKKEIMEQHREYRKNNKEKIQKLSRKNYEVYGRNKGLRNRYGISSEGYKTLYEIQNGKCAICNIHQSKLNRRLDIDHDHKTNKIRELLCNSCNNMIKNENPFLLIKGAKYLNKHRNGRT